MWLEAALRRQPAACCDQGRVAPFALEIGEAQRQLAHPADDLPLGRAKDDQRLWLAFLPVAQQLCGLLAFVEHKLGFQQGKLVAARPIGIVAAQGVPIEVGLKEGVLAGQREEIEPEPQLIGMLRLAQTLQQDQQNALG